MRLTRQVGTVLLILLGPARLAGQTVTGTITGAVLDPSGAVIPGASVLARNPVTGFSRAGITDGAGNYVLTFIPPGVYDLTVSRAGFERTVRREIVVEADERVRVDLTLAVGKATQTVEVAARAPLVQSNDANVGEVLSTHTLSSLPLNKRNFVDLIQLTSGVGPGRPGEFAGQSTIDNFRGRFTFNAAGQRSTTNSFILDGVDNNAALFNAGGMAVVPIPDAIQEIKVSTANFSPEFGRAIGAVVSVQTKAGTNELHGTLFEFLRNSRLDANAFFNNRAGKPRPPFQQNQFGFVLGGPVVRDRTFFFGDYQGFRVRNTQSFLASVPTAAARRGDFSSPLFRPIFDPATAAPDGSGGVKLKPFPNNVIPPERRDPLAAQVLNLYPLPNTNFNQLGANYLNTPKLRRDDDQFDIRIDHRFGNSSSLFIRYSYDNSEQLFPNALFTPENPFGGGGKGNDSRIRAQGVAINYIRPLSSRLFAETRFGFARTNYGGEPLGANSPLFDKFQIPNLRISNLVNTIPIFGITRLTSLGPQGNVPNFSALNNFQVVQNFVYSRGRHVVKFGGDILRRQLNNDFTGFPTGSFSFNGAFTNIDARVSPKGGEPLADFLLGLPVSAQRDILLGGFGRRDLIASGYFQDDMKLTRRLALNLGVRWDIWTPFVEVSDRQSNFDLATGRLVLASGQGRLGRALRDTDANNFAPRLGLAYDLTGNGRTVLRAGYSISYIEDLSGGRTILSLNPPFAFSEQMINAQGAIPNQVLSSGFSLPVIPSVDDAAGVIHIVDTNFRSGYAQTWSFGIQRQLGPDLLLDAAYIGAKGTKLFERIDANQPRPGPGPIPPRRPFFSQAPRLGTLDGVTSAGNSSYHSFQVKLTKRFSKGLSFLLTYTNGRAVEDSEGVGETATEAVVVQTMAQNAQNRRAEKALASFDMKQRLIFSPIYELPFGANKPHLSSGAAGHLLGGWEVGGIASLLDGQPVTVQMSSSNLNTGTFQRPNRTCDGNIPSSRRSVDRFFDTSCFIPPAAFIFGNAGRNLLIGPGTANIDFSLSRTFRLSETVKLEFRSEFFNLFNRPQFNPPGNLVGDPNFGKITGVRLDSQREIQFALRLSF